VPAAFEVSPQVVEVVDLAVEYDADRAVLVEDRLVPACDVDDGEAAHGEACVLVQVESLAIGPAVPKRRVHALKDIALSRCAKRAYDPRDPTHSCSKPCLLAVAQIEGSRRPDGMLATRQTMGQPRRRANSGAWGVPSLLEFSR
jgi:hypothetical protein